LNPGIDRDRVNRPAVRHLKANTPAANGHLRSERPPGGIPRAQAGVKENRLSLPPQFDAVAPPAGYGLQTAVDGQFDGQRLAAVAGAAWKVKPCSRPRAWLSYHSMSPPRRYSTRVPSA